MTKRELNRLKKLIVDEFEFIREKNNSGIVLWGELHDLVDDLEQERDSAIRKNRLTDDERDALSEFWWEQLDLNISFTVRTR
jgi:hypothetical protein